MPTTDLTDASFDDDWLSLQDASQILGVAASTLRRWGDAGRLQMKRTLGGHRRFARTEVMQLLNDMPKNVSVANSAVSLPTRSPVAWGIDASEMARQEWHVRLAARPGAERMRGLGQRLLGLLIQYVNRPEEDSRFLQEARTVGVNYAIEMRAAQSSMYDAVEAFLFFRSAFSELAIPQPGLAHPIDVADAMVLHTRLNRFMDAVLLGVIAGYEGKA